MPWGPEKEPEREVTGGRWRPRDTLLPPNTKPGWWVRTPVPANFSGSGVLAAQIKQISPRIAYFNSDGDLDANVMQKYSLPLDLGGEGTFQPQVMQREFRQVDFNGMGYINFDTIAIIPDTNDGLTATAYERYPAQASFSGAGALSAAIRGYATLAANLTGGGVLSASLKPIYALTVALAGGGQLTAGMTEGVSRIAQFLGSGQLSASVFQAYLRSLPLAGAGQLTAILNERYPQGADKVGEGTLGITIMQRYLIKLGFGDDFNRADDFSQIGNGWAARANVMGTYLNGVVPITPNVWCEASAPVIMNSDDMEVSFTLGQLIGSGADYTTILLGMSESGEGVFVFFNGGAGITIYTQTAWDTTGLASVASIGIGQTTGDKWTARRVGNTYTILKNGVPTGLSWSDTTNIIPRDINHRQVGLAGYTDGTNARVMDYFTATDLGSLRGEGVLSAVAMPRYTFTAPKTGNGILSATMAYPVVGPTPQQYAAAGAYTYPIPYWCRYIDVVLLGGGGGGKGLAFIGSWGDGGNGGDWSVTTLERGVHIPWTTTQITGVVGSGGTAGSSSGGNGGNGTATTATATGMTSKTGAAGAGATTTLTDSKGDAPVPQSQTLNGQTYTGGANVAAGGAGKVGNAPGGGGSGSQVSATAGGAGAIGRAWFYAYQ